jgi:hypothetical protein
MRTLKKTSAAMLLALAAMATGQAASASVTTHSALECFGSNRFDGLSLLFAAVSSQADPGQVSKVFCPLTRPNASSAGDISESRGRYAVPRAFVQRECVRLPVVQRCRDGRSFRGSGHPAAWERGSVHERLCHHRWEHGRRSLRELFGLSVVQLPVGRLRPWSQGPTPDPAISFGSEYLRAQSPRTCRASSPMRSCWESSRRSIRISAGSPAFFRAWVARQSCRFKASRSRPSSCRNS